MDEETKEPIADETENKSTISADLIRGHINTIILRTLYERDKYGYEIIEEIEKKSHGQYTLKQPTLYSALKRLETQGYINAYWKTDEVSLGGRRKYYTLTDSGREITEKNQAEWEYSRTVIDNLISDRSFDFSRPAPASVDFKILKQSTTRVPKGKVENDDEDDVKKENEEKEIETGDKEQRAEPVKIETDETKEVKENERNVVSENDEMSAEQRRIVHENYLRLISEPAASVPKEDNIVPSSENIDTDKLIYNNKPQTERDYRNLINKLFNKTITQNGPNPAFSKQQQYQNERPAENISEYDELSDRAEKDGLKINSSEFVMSGRKKNYNRGGALFKSSLIVSIILLLEFTISLLFKNDLGVSLAYPFVILALAAAQLLIFGVIYYNDYGKTTRKPATTTYLTASIIITVIIIVVIFLISLLLQVNYASAADIMSKIVFPCIVALNIPVFAICFYAFSK